MEQNPLGGVLGAWRQDRGLTVAFWLLLVSPLFGLVGWFVAYLINMMLIPFPAWAGVLLGVVFALILGVFLVQRAATLQRRLEASPDYGLPTTWERF